MTGKIVKFIRDFDIYGHPISVMYKGSDVLKTNMGALCTLITYALVLSNLITLLIEFSDGSRQQSSFEVFTIDRFTEGAFNLTENHFDVQIIIAGVLDPRLARISAYNTVTTCRYNDYNACANEG